MFVVDAAVEIITTHRPGPTTRFTGTPVESCAGCPWRGPSHAAHVVQLLSTQAVVLEQVDTAPPAQIETPAPSAA